MKLYNTYSLCKASIGALKSLNIIESQQKAYRIKNWAEYVSALNKIRHIPIFTDIADNIYKTIPSFIRGDSQPEIDTITKNSLVKLHGEALCMVSTIIDLYESMGIPEKENGIDVKIPNCQNLNEYIKYLSEINFIFSQCPYLLHKDETIKFSSVDVGSNWLSFAVEVSIGATTAFTIIGNLAKIVEKALILKSHFNSIRQQEMAMEAIRQKNKIAENELEIFDILRKHYMTEVVDSLEKEISPLEDGDQRGRLEKSLEKLSSLLGKGVEIYASLDAPENVQVLFPTIDGKKQIPLPETKQLEDKASSVSDAHA